MEIWGQSVPRGGCGRCRSSFTLPEWFTTDCCKAAYNYVLMYRGSPTRSHCYGAFPRWHFMTALPYTFSVKPKWRTVIFWVFVARSSAIAYFRMSPPLGHSTVGVLITVKVSWRFGCAHARSSRRIVFNSSMCRRTYVALCTMCKCSTCSFSIL